MLGPLPRLVLWVGEGLPVTVSEALYLQTSFSYRNLNLEGIPRL